MSRVLLTQSVLAWDPQSYDDDDDHHRELQVVIGIRATGTQSSAPKRHPLLVYTFCPFSNTVHFQDNHDVSNPLAVGDVVKSTPGHLLIKVNDKVNVHAVREMIAGLKFVWGTPVTVEVSEYLVVVGVRFPRQRRLSSILMETQMYNVHSRQTTAVMRWWEESGTSRYLLGDVLWRDGRESATRMHKVTDAREKQKVLDALPSCVLRKMREEKQSKVSLDDLLSSCGNVTAVGPRDRFSLSGIVDQIDRQVTRISNEQGLGLAVRDEHGLIASRLHGVRFPAPCMFHNLVIGDDGVGVFFDTRSSVVVAMQGVLQQKTKHHRKVAAVVVVVDRAVMPDLSAAAPRTQFLIRGKMVAIELGDGRLVSSVETAGEIVTADQDFYVHVGASSATRVLVRKHKMREVFPFAVDSISAWQCLRALLNPKNSEFELLVRVGEAGRELELDKVEVGPGG
jgi:hypothetical protein